MSSTGVLTNASRVLTTEQRARLDEADLQKVDIRDGIKDTLVVMGAELAEANVQVALQLDSVPEKSCYPRDLNQMFLYLLRNAHQAGAHRVITRTHAAEDAVVIEVLDDGEGVPEDDLQRIFNPGFTTRGVGVGTGLGLSTSWQIAQRHRGTITAKNRPEGGARLKVTLKGAQPLEA